MTNVCADLTDVTLADEDTNSILADNAKRAIQGNEAMQVISPDDQNLKHFATNDKILTPKKYKSDFKKYRKSEGKIQDYLN